MSERKKKPFGVEVAKRLRTVMFVKSISSADIMRRTKLGSGQISDYLNGYVVLRADCLKELCKVLNCSADYLLGLTDYMHNPNVPENFDLWMEKGEVK